jgi:hypothetical protein
MAIEQDPSTIPPRDPVAFGASCAQTLRAILPGALANGCDPWRVAGLVALMEGHPGATLVTANALRWQVAHGFRARGFGAAALALGRELLIDCEALE